MSISKEYSILMMQIENTEHVYCFLMGIKLNDEMKLF